MKPSDDLKKDLYKGNDVETIKEIAEKCGLADSTVRLHADRMVQSGIWKMVYVKRGRTVAKAYKKVKNK